MDERVRERERERKREKERIVTKESKKRIISHKIIGGCSYFRVTNKKLFLRKSVQPSHRPTLYHLLIHHAVSTSHLRLVFRLKLTTEKHL